VYAADVARAIKQLKGGKGDGDKGLFSDHFINAGDEFACHLSLVYGALLMHGFSVDDMLRCTLIPIPKGKSSNITDSGNYRGIALGSIYGKVFDLILLNKFTDLLCTAEQQFGFKRKHSTTMCTMVLKETLAYYTTDGGNAFCTLLEATKAFDRVNYCKLFRELIKRDLPVVYIRLMVNMYTDGLLQRLIKSGVGCYIGDIFVGALAYADDIVLVATSASATRLMLKICEDYGREFAVIFNASKSACLFVSKGSRCYSTLLQFQLDDKPLTFVSEYTHLGHIITANLSDTSDIMFRKNSFCGKVNNVLCYFATCSPDIKFRLMRQYCCDFYGSVLWDLSHPSVDDICAAWRKAARRVWGLPYRTHSVLLAPVSGALPLLDELACRCVRFIGNCLDSENTVVSHVARYAIFSGRACSPLGLNAQFCCGRYNKALNDLQNISKTSIWQHVRSSQSQSVTDTANVIAELLMVKSGYAVLPIWSNFEVERCIEELCLL